MTYTVKSKPGCPWCEKAKELINQTGELIFEQVHETPTEIANFKAEGYKTFPQIWHNGKYVGGHDDLVKYLADSEEY